MQIERANTLIDMARAACGDSGGAVTLLLVAAGRLGERSGVTRERARALLDAVYDASEYVGDEPDAATITIGAR